MFQEVVERLGLTRDGPELRSTTPWRGTLSGQAWVSSVTIYSQLGAPLYSLHTDVFLEPPLDLGLTLHGGEVPPGCRAEDHLPPSWCGRRALQSITAVHSDDPS